MVTGDNPLTAKYIAEKAGVDDFIAEAKPEYKMEYIKKEMCIRDRYINQLLISCLPVMAHYWHIAWQLTIVLIKKRSYGFIFNRICGLYLSLIHIYHSKMVDR